MLLRTQPDLITDCSSQDGRSKFVVSICESQDLIDASLNFESISIYSL